MTWHSGTSEPTPYEVLVRPKHGRNELTAQPAVPFWRKFLAQFTNVLVILLLVAGTISAGVVRAEFINAV